MSENPECIRCGMCCMVVLCPFGEEIPRGETGECGYLTIDEEDQAVCNCKEAVERFAGSGCNFLLDSWSDLYLHYLNNYNVEERRENLKENGGYYGQQTCSKAVR